MVSKTIVKLRNNEESNMHLFLSRMIALSLLFFLFQESYSQEKNVYLLVHPYHGNNTIFDLANKKINRDDCSYPFFALKEAFLAKGYTLKTADCYHNSSNLSDAHALIVLDTTYHQYLIQAVASAPQAKKILLLFEPPLISKLNYESSLHYHFDTVFTLCDALLVDKKYKKLFYPQPSLIHSNPIPFHKKKFCVTIAGNKYESGAEELYSARRETIQFFEKNHPKEFDLYGTGWHKKQNPSYKGAVACKKDTLQEYKYCICYENSKHVTGYITEKIFDCFVAGTVPVYYGADNIKDYVPKYCFIDREQFESDKDLYDFLKSITEEEYEKYICAITKYLMSKEIELFSTDYFVETMITSILSDKHE